MKANLNVFDFELSEDDISILSPAAFSLFHLAFLAFYRVL